MPFPAPSTDVAILHPATFKDGWYFNLAVREPRDFPASITVLDGSEGRDFA